MNAIMLLLGGLLLADLCGTLAGMGFGPPAGAAVALVGAAAGVGFAARLAEVEGEEAE